MSTDRFPSTEAQLALAARFGLPHTNRMQDWEYEVADVGRFDEFLAAYTPSLPADERLSLMEILIQCVEDSAFGGESDSYWNRVRPLLDANRTIHAGTINYWACLDAENEDEMFHVSSRMRSLLGGSHEQLGGNDA